MILGELLKRLFSNKIIVSFILVAPLVILILVATLSNDPQTTATHNIGIVDNDNSILSNAIEKELSSWYNCKRISSDDINSSLIEGEFSCVLEIHEDFQESLQNGIVPKINIYSLKINEMQILVSAQIEGITKSLLILANNTKTENLQLLINDWQADTNIKTTELTIPVDWNNMAYWLGFYSFFTILISTFIINNMMEDRLRGLPDRIGTLPISLKSYNLQSILAVFLILSISMFIIIFGVQLITGYYIKHILKLLIVLILMNLISISLMLALHSLLKTRDRTMVASSFITTIFSMVGGVFWPMEFAPDYLQKLAYFTPNYWFGKAVAGCIQPTFTEYYLPLIFMMLFTIIFFLLGSWKRIEKIME